MNGTKNSIGIFPVYYVFKNNSHLYVVQAENVTYLTHAQKMTEQIGRLHIHENNIKPILINCTIAPLAKDCLHRNMPFHTENLTKSSINTTDQFLDTLVQQHRHTIIISILMVLVFLLILIFSIRKLLNVIQKSNKTNSISHYASTEFQQNHSFQMASTYEFDDIKIDNKQMIRSHTYDYLPSNDTKCAPVVSPIKLTNFNNTFKSLADELDIEAKDLDLDFNILDDNKEEEIPDYLSVSKSSFRANFLSELYCYQEIDDFYDLQYLAIVTHKLSIINLQQKLWHSYIQCGTGKLNLNERLQRQNISSSLCIWPQQVTTILIKQNYNNMIDENKITQDIYVNFVNKIQLHFDVKAKQMQIEFEMIKNRFESVFTDIVDKIDTFVRKRDLTTAIRLHFEARTALVEYNYIDQVFQKEYLQQKPNEIQIKLANRICNLVYNKGKSSQELTLFQMGVLYNKLPDILNIIEETLPTTITNLNDTAIRERLSKQYVRIIQKAKYDLMSVLSTAAQFNKDEHRETYDKEMVQLWDNQRQLPNDERLTENLLTIFDQRQQNIIKCLEYIYNIKPDFLVKAPTLRSIKK
ncbi:unnamed protein product [Rotaria magnacalcarata]|uniref:Uncharacterized protein n=2 Tax=Rotaria magnacalcarata TaxID=392030 RepID=A0A816SE63_9BILA|nr:unnamed protein product [Rotaria magnacalcarata]